MRALKPWKRIAAGYYLHPSTGVEVEKQLDGLWWIRTPATHAHRCPGRTFAHITDLRTMTAAIERAEADVIPDAREAIDRAWDEALFEPIGRPHTWPIAQADPDTVRARRAAVRLTHTITGFTAPTGQLVKHIELGIPGVMVSSDGSLSYVRFAGDAEKSAVHSADVVALDTNGWFSCEILDDPAHKEHGEAETPECLVPEPDQELIGPELVEVRPGRYEAADGVFVYRHTDGTWWSYGPARLDDDSICAGQKTLGRTYLWINRWRAAMDERREADHGRADTEDTARTALAAAENAAATAETAYRAAIAAGRPGGYEAGVQQTANINVARARLALDIVQGCGWRTVRFVLVENSNNDSDSWQVLRWRAVEALPSETAAAQALRCAVEQQLTGEQASMMTPKPWRVRVWSDPTAADPDGEWTNLTDPCPPGQHDPGKHPIATGVSRADGSTIRLACCAGCFHAVWRVAPHGISDADNPFLWVLEGEPLPEPEPGVIYLPIECVKTTHYGMEINDGLGTWYILNSVGPVHRDTGKVEVSVAGRPTAELNAMTTVQLRPAPIEHDGLPVNEHGVSLYTITGSLHFAITGDSCGGTPTGVWRLAGIAENVKIHPDDVGGAQTWAAAVLADLGDVVVGWQHHREPYGELWKPIFADGPGLHSPGLDHAQTQTQTTGGQSEPDGQAAEPATSLDAVSFGYRIQTRTGRHWRTVRTGNTPRIFRAVQTDLEAIADTVLGNAGPVLGLGPSDPLPPVRVRTWHRQSGLTGSASRDT